MIPCCRLKCSMKFVKRPGITPRWRSTSLKGAVTPGLSLAPCRGGHFIMRNTESESSSLASLMRARCLKVWPNKGGGYERSESPRENLADVFTGQPGMYDQQDGAGC